MRTRLDLGPPIPVTVQLQLRRGEQVGGGVIFGPGVGGLLEIIMGLHTPTIAPPPSACTWLLEEVGVPRLGVPCWLVGRAAGE